MTTNYAWTRIEVGYTVIRVPRTPSAEYLKKTLAVTKSMRELLNQRLSAARRLNWLTGNSTAVEVSSTGHDWVGHVLTKEMNRALMDVPGRLQITEEKLCVLTKDGYALQDAENKPYGTRCILLGERWYNYRSYELDADVLEIEIPDDGLIFATLVWPCEGAECDAIAITS